MPLTQYGGGGVLASTAGLVVVVGLFLLFVSSAEARTWLAQRLARSRAYFYGPRTPAKVELATAPATPQDDTTPDDGFDYSIFAQPNPSRAVDPLL